MIQYDVVFLALIFLLLCVVVMVHEARNMLATNQFLNQVLSHQEGQGEVSKAEVVEDDALEIDVEIWR